MPALRSLPGHTPAHAARHSALAKASRSGPISARKAQLNAVRTEGDWEGWTDFFLEGVATIASEAVASACDIFALITADRTRVLAQDTTSVSVARLFELLPNHPIVTVTASMRLLGTSEPTVTRAVRTLESAGVLVETTGRMRDRCFAYWTYIDRLRAGTELMRD